MGLRGRPWRDFFRFAACALATVQVVWFYVAEVHTAFSLEAFEAGRASVPFQQRLAMQPLLRWAHNSPALLDIAAGLSRQRAWFPGGVHAEALVEFPIDVAAVVITGCIAEWMYARASRRRLLRGWLYPMTLAAVAIVFDLYTVHGMRFVYDLPAMAVFATGLYLLYTEKPLWLFALLFLCGTTNRETTLLLLPALLLQRYTLARAGFAAALLGCWLGWHAWVTHLFAENSSAVAPRFWLNLGLMACPLAWPQLGTTMLLCLLPLLCSFAEQHHSALHRWRLLVPLWLAFMLRYGLLIETRVFGELIAYLVPVTALVMERQVVLRLGAAQRVTRRGAEAVMVN